MRAACTGLLMFLLMPGTSFAQPAAQSTSADAARLTALVEQVRAKPADASRRAEARALGFELLRAARFADAWIVFGALIDAAPDDRPAQYGGAVALFNLRRLDESERLAVAAATPAAQADAGSSVGSLTADALVLVGVIRAVAGDNAGALAALTKATTLAPTSFDAQFALGRARYGAGDPAGAAVAFRTATGLRPDSAQAQFFLATALEGAGDNEAALVAYRALVAAQPGQADGHLGLGALLIKLGGDRTTEGIAELTRAVALDGDLYEARIGLGRTLIRAGSPAAAVEHLQRAAALAPNNPEPHYQLALAYRRLGQGAEAAKEMALVKQLHETRRGSKQPHQ